MKLIQSEALYTFVGKLRKLAGAKITVPGREEKTIISRECDAVYERGAFPGHLRRIA